MTDDPVRLARPAHDRVLDDLTDMAGAEVLVGTGSSLATAASVFAPVGNFTSRSHHRADRLRRSDPATHAETRCSSMRQVFLTAKGTVISLTR